MSRRASYIPTAQSEAVWFVLTALYSVAIFLVATDVTCDPLSIASVPTFVIIAMLLSRTAVVARKIRLEDQPRPGLMTWAFDALCSWGSARIAYSIATLEWDDTGALVGVFYAAGDLIVFLVSLRLLGHRTN